MHKGRGSSGRERVPGPPEGPEPFHTLCVNGNRTVPSLPNSGNSTPEGWMSSRGYEGHVSNLRNRTVSYGL